MKPQSIGWATAIALLSFSATSLAQAQTVTFSDVNDAVPARCYDSATTQADAVDPNLLKIGMNTGTISGTFFTNAGCYASDEGPTTTMDTISFVASAPDGYYISRITFTQSGTTGGSRGGAGFYGTNWVVDDDALDGPGAIDLTGLNKTVVPVKITTFLAAAGGTSRAGTASASNASVLVELLPLTGPPPPPPLPPPPNPVPRVTAISPSVMTSGGGAFTLTVTGSNFVNGTVVHWNGADKPTVAVSGTQLRATIGVSDIAVAGTAEVTVFNPPTPFYFVDGGLSNAEIVTINPAPTPNPLPETTALEPAAVVAGSNAFTLTVNGSRFIPGSVVRWNGEVRTTTFVSPTRLLAVIGNPDVLAEGTATVTVFNPATGFNPPPDGGLSNPQTFTITAVPPPPPPVPGPFPAPAHGNVNDMRGKEWRQLTATRGLTRAQLLLLCPQDGPTPYLCAGMVGNVDVTDWIWANSPQVFDLFSYFTTGVSPASPSVGGAEYALPALQFQGLFNLTQFVTGCSMNQGCDDFRSVGGVTASTDGVGDPIGGAVNASQNLADPFVGGFSIGTVPDDGSSARGAFMWRPTGLGAGTAHAYGDEGRAPSPYGGTALNVMNNDWVGGVQATGSNASVTLASPPSPYSDHITLGADGSVQVSAGARAGAYTFSYSLCTMGAPANCDDAHVSVLVPSFPLVVANDQAFAAFGTGGSPVNVLTNDSLNSLPAATSVVALRQVSSSSPGVSLNTSTGAVDVAAGTPSGTHALVYEACEVANPVNCQRATVTLMARSIDAVDDVFAKIAKDGGISASVLTNDRFNGAAATAATVQLSLVTALPAGITFDLSTGRFAAKDAESGDYSMTYRICEVGSSTNCDSASLMLEVSGSGD